tara:strand:+ start:917 stop:1813 length:897 start_codon:yes stop_codon:yes gene_type:complete
MSIIVLGGEGLLGKRIVLRMKQGGHNIKSISRKDTADIVINNYTADQIKECIELERVSHIINTTALTDVNECEVNKDLARKINIGICEEISSMQSNYQFKLIHISTDQVYSGDGPHSENFAQPINYYGKTKLEGEKVLGKDNCIILRTNFIGKSLSLKPSYTDWLISQSKKKELMKISRSKFSPITIGYLTNIIEQICFKYNINGVYNLGSKWSINKLSFTKEFVKKQIGDDKINLISYQTLDKNIQQDSFIALRPKDMSLDCSKFEKHTGVILPNPKEVMNKLLLEYKDINDNEIFR